MSVDVYVSSSLLNAFFAEFHYAYPYEQWLNSLSLLQYKGNHPRWLLIHWLYLGSVSWTLFIWFINLNGFFRLWNSCNICWILMYPLFELLMLLLIFSCVANASLWQLCIVNWLTLMTFMNTLNLSNKWRVMLWTQQIVTTVELIGFY